MTSANTDSALTLITYVRYPQSPDIKGRIAFASQTNDDAIGSEAAAEKPVLHSPPVPAINAWTPDSPR